MWAELTFVCSIIYNLKNIGQAILVGKYNEESCECLVGEINAISNNSP
jgi:hypothetical protein